MEVILNFISTVAEWSLRFYEICVESLIWLCIFFACMLLALCIGHCIDYVRHDRHLHWSFWGLLGVALIFPVAFIIYGQAEHETKMYEAQMLVAEKQLLLKEKAKVEKLVQKYDVK